MDAKEFKQLLKELKVPSPTVTGDSLTYFWVKRHGHAGANTIKRVRENAYAVGFQQWDGKSSSNADGSRVGCVSTYTRGNVTLELESFYGQTAHENRFSIRVKVKEPV